VFNVLVGNVPTLGDQFVEALEGFSDAPKQAIVSFPESSECGFVFVEHQPVVEIFLVQFLDGGERVVLGPLEGQHSFLELKIVHAVGPVVVVSLLQIVL
jgi:hypothetical protein